MTALPLAIALALCGTACSQQFAVKEQPVMDDARQKAIDAGIKQIAERFPDFSPARKTPTVEDHGDTWLFTYALPADMLGGAPVVILTKSDLSVQKAYRTQ